MLGKTRGGDPVSSLEASKSGERSEDVETVR